MGYGKLYKKETILFFTRFHSHVLYIFDNLFNLVSEYLWLFPVGKFQFIKYENFQSGKIR